MKKALQSYNWLDEKVVDTADRWLSAHIHFHDSVGSPAADRLILNQVIPFVRRCQREKFIDGYFFVRYTEGGPHIRLRLSGDKGVLTNHVKQALIDHLYQAWRVVGFIDPKVCEPQALEYSKIVRWVPYVPEHNRYGGAKGVKLAELFFQCSSDVAVNVLRHCSVADRSKRLAYALFVMVVLLQTFHVNREEAADLSRRYGAGYASAVGREKCDTADLIAKLDRGSQQQDYALVAHVHELWAALSAGSTGVPLLERFAKRLKHVREVFEKLMDNGELTRDGRVLADRRTAVSAIVPSYIHMTNNRIGISLIEEAYLGRILATILADVNSGLAG